MPAHKTNRRSHPLAFSLCFNLTMQLFTKILADKRGFTLLEMSIVIVIIGLIAGGIVAGQSFIRSSQLTTLVNDGKLYQRAFGMFEDAYAAPPGDFRTATSVWPSAAGNGNGDGRIYGAVGGTQGEMFLAWQHLQMGGFITGNYTGVAGSLGILNCVPGSNAPTTSMDRVGMQFQDLSTPEYTGATYFDGFYYRPLMIGLATSLNALCWAVFLPPKDMLTIDSKYDDGLPGMGSIRSLKSDTSCVSGTDPATATYITSTKSQQCRLLMTGQ